MADPPAVETASIVPAPAVPVGVRVTPQTKRVHKTQTIHTYLGINKYLFPMKKKPCPPQGMQSFFSLSVIDIFSLWRYCQ